MNLNLDVVNANAALAQSASDQLTAAAQQLATVAAEVDVLFETTRWSAPAAALAVEAVARIRDATHAAHTMIEEAAAVMWGQLDAAAVSWGLT